MRTLPFLRRSVVVVGVVAVLLSGCSANGSDTARTTTSAASSAPSTSTTSTPITVQPPTTSTIQPSDSTDGSGLKFRPVVGSQLCSAVTPEGPDDEPQSTETTVPTPGQPEVVPAADDILCYGLGPAAATGEDLARAVADTDPNTGSWVVSVTPLASAEAKLNALFDACFDGAPTCPAAADSHGAVAIELDGKVISAPTIQARGLGSSPFQILGSFTQQEAQTLTARLNG